jgi:Transglycosylase SLT domain/D-alanyl-D-alanine carboxypeptidase/Putative Flp pilus-assembly TadE/G-like
MAPLVLATELPQAGGGLATAAALAVALATGRTAGGGERAVALIEVGGGRRGPTMLASDAARSLERRLRDAGRDCAARGRIAWLALEAAEGWLDDLVDAIESIAGATAVVVLPPALLGEALACDELDADAVLLRADRASERSLAALAVAELQAAGLRVRVVTRAPGRVASRRALAGIEPGGDASRRAARLARGLLGGPSPGARRAIGSARLAEAGQALPLVLGGMLALVCTTLVLAAVGGAVTGKSRTQRAADLAALSAARSMRDDFERLFVPARHPDGSANPAHLAKRDYLQRAQAAGEDAGRRNGVDPGRLTIEFPDAASFAPLRARAEVTAELDTPGGLPRVAVAAHAEAEAVTASGTEEATAAPEFASGGGYAGRLEYRQGEGMRPDVAAAFDAMAAAASADGVDLLINSGFRSDAEQAILWEQNPDPRWVAPPGTSLHRCATELDLGPAAAYGWLAANASRFGFVQRYSWEAWHYGFVDGPPPCSAAGDRVDSPPGGYAEPLGAPDGGGAEISLPAFVPARYREAIAAAAWRWNVSGTLLAAQLMAESNFNPFAVSPAGAAGIAQFMPGTAAAYGLDDPFDAETAIDAQAHLMSDLLEQFGDPSLALAAYNAGPAPVVACGCVPAYPETQAYVARILGLIDGAGSTLAGGPPALEVRLVE